MNLENEVRTRRLQALLAEAVDGGVPNDLAQRIVARCSPPAARAPRVSAFAAICMLAGIAVVAATARWTRGDRLAQGAPQPVAQDPAAKTAAPVGVTVTTAMVREALRVVEAPPPGDGVGRLLALARRSPGTLVVAPGVGGESTVDLSGRTWHEAVALVADELGVGWAEFGAVVVVGIGPRVPPARLRCTIQVPTAVAVHDLPRILHRSAGGNLVVGATASGAVALAVEDVPVRALLEVVAARLSLQVVPCGTVLALRAQELAPPPPRLVLNFQNRAFGDVVDSWTRLAGRNVVLSPEARGVVSLVTTGASEDDLLAALAAAVGTEVEVLDRGIIRIVPRLAAPANVAWSSNARTGAETMAEVATRIGMPDGLLQVTGAEPRATVVVAEARGADVLRAMAVAAGRSWLRRDAAYVVR